MAKKYEVRVVVDDDVKCYYTDSLLRMIYLMHKLHKENCKNSEYRYVKIYRR